MKITAIDTFAVRTDLVHPWLFCAIRTDEGLTGYSEFGDAGVARGLLGLVSDLGQTLIGEDPRPVEKIYLDLYRKTRQMSGGAVAMAIAGIELALWDLKGKALGVPVYELFGGPYRTRQRCYWSHFASYRSHRPEFYPGAPLRTLEDVAALTREAAAQGYDALKTNLVFPGGNPPSLLQGFLGADDQNAPRWLIDHAVKQISLMREAAGPAMEIALDINYHFKTEGAVRLGRALEPYDLMWLEHDCESPEALAQLRQSVRMPICSGEQLQAPRQYLPFFERRAMDVVMIDVPWQGFSAAKKVADLAELYELNVAPHNFNSHLATAISLNLCAAVSNVKMLEYDVDSSPGRDALTTVAPRIENGMMDIPTGPGWGCDLDEEAAAEYATDLDSWGPWKL